MHWVIKQLIDQKPLRKQKTNHYNTDGNRLSYCNQCKCVWETTSSKYTYFYRHLPTYGLLRKICNKCKKETNE